MIFSRLLIFMTFTSVLAFSTFAATEWIGDFDFEEQAIIPPPPEPTYQTSTSSETQSSSGVVFAKNIRPVVNTETGETNIQFTLVNPSSEIKTGLVEFQINTVGACSWCKALSFFSQQKTCDTKTPYNVHKTFSLDPNTELTTTLSSTIPQGSWDAYLVSTDACCTTNPGCKSIEPFGWGTFVLKGVTVKQVTATVGGGGVIKPVAPQCLYDNLNSGCDKVMGYSVGNDPAKYGCMNAGTPEAYCYVKGIDPLASSRGFWLSPVGIAVMAVIGLSLAFIVARKKLL